MIFKYHVRDNSGISRNGEMEAINQEEAVKKLQDQGLIVISCEVVSNSRKREKYHVLNKELGIYFAVTIVVLIFSFLCFRYGPFMLNKLESLFNKEKNVFKVKAENKIDKQKFEKVYRAAKTLTATIEGGINYVKLQELNQNFLTEISIAVDSINTEKEKEVIALYKFAYEAYKTSEAVWDFIIKYNLDDYRQQYYQAKPIFEILKPIIEQFGLVLIPKELEYSGFELHTSELSKIWVVADEYIDQANAIVMGKTP